jgi:hypothetical protein
MPTPRMLSGIRACCRLEKRAARHRAPSIDPALKPFTSETDSARSAKGTGLLQWSPSRASSPFLTLLSAPAQGSNWLLPLQPKRPKLTQP